MENSFSPKTAFVQKIFTQIAQRYDLMNDVMSLGLHRKWRRLFIQRLPITPRLKILDMATGTGDIPFGILKQYVHLNPQLILCDPNPEMIKKGKQRSYDLNLFKGLTWVESFAEKTPFEDSSFDLCTMAFGFRNVTNHTQVLKEVLRILKPGGSFFCLEFSHIDPSLKSFYELYTFSVLPQLGKWLANTSESYEYLAQSIADFPNQDQLKENFEQAGFINVFYENLSRGIVSIHSGWKGQA